MEPNPNLAILSDWTEEFNVTLLNNNSLCVAVFSTDRELLFANNSMHALFKLEPCNSFINPTFDSLLALNNSIPLIFEGFLTLGDYSSVNTSIWAQVYRKENNLLVVGGINAAQLLEQNETMHQLNREISNLQRELIREKHHLENTLNELNLANNELKELNATKDKFFSILAHDLKNPFNSIIGFSDLLVKNAIKYSPEKLMQIAQTINDTSKQTYTLLENLLEWSRLQTGKLIAEPIKVKPADLVYEVKALCEPIAKSKNIDLQTKIESNDAIWADKEMIKTVLRNLVTNAMKFTNQNGIVTLSTRQSDNAVLFIISDTGMGIEPEHIASLFKIDCKLSKKGTAGETGTGLGLILCQEFIEKHNGKIWVESILGKGSNFKFSIPIYKD